MTTRVHILSERMSEASSRGFLTPLLVSDHRLRELGLQISYFGDVEPSLADCDVLLINGKHYGWRWQSEPETIVAELAGWAERAGALIYCDIYDSSGLVHIKTLPHVSMYLKSYLLRDRNAYLRPMYGGRPFTDYYHRTANVIDSDPQLSEPITDTACLAKLRVGWNMAYAHHGPLTSRLSALYRFVPASPLLRLPTRYHKPNAARENASSCRVSTRYSRKTIAYQRQQIVRLMQGRTATDRVSRSKYFRELTQSKVAISPFGWGEFAMRDYEAFVCGSLLFKPDMEHLETYPSLYTDGETMVAHTWNLEDFDEKLEMILGDYSSYVAIAEAGQARYRFHATTNEGSEAFAVRFAKIIADALVADVPRAHEKSVKA